MKRLRKFGKPWLSIGLAVAMIAGVLPSGAAAAVTDGGDVKLFQYDFESDAVGAPPAVDAADPEAWSGIARSVESPLTVIEGNGGHVLEYARLESASGGGGPRVDKQIDPAGRSRLVAEFQIKTQGHQFYLDLRGVDGTTPPVTRLLLLDDAGLVPNPPEGVNWSANEFVHAKVVIDAEARTFAQSLNGVTIRSGVPLHDGLDLTKPVVFRFSAVVHPGDRLYLDNVAISGAMTEEETQSVVAKLTPEHPRLLATAADFSDLKTGVATDPTQRQWYEKMRSDSERILGEPASQYGFPDGRTLLNVSREVLSRTYALAMSYRIDGDERYAERLWMELEAAAAFPDWNPESFLSTAEMTHAFAIGYDWLYEYWSPERRETLRDAIVDLGLTPGLHAYESGAWWVSTTNNWNLVCNGGLAMGALAIGDEEPDLADAILQAALASIPAALGEYAPDGSYPEGIGYWAYANRYLVPFIASLQTATGETFGLTETAGLSQTGEYPLYITGTSGLAFNYSDASAGTQRPPEMLWFADAYDRPVYAWWGLGGTGASATQLLWYDPNAVVAGPREAGMPLDKYFRSSELATGRSAWEDPRGLFVGLKAGDNQENHGDLDLGTFVLDALGVRWATELGLENYGSPGYWSNGPDGQRWTYYRKRAEGQNTLVVNPDGGIDQDPLAKGDIIRFEAGPSEMFAIAELSEAYAHRGVTSWQRGISLFDHRRQVLVQDELKAAGPADVWWFMHTQASVEVSADGRTAILTNGGERLQARILSPSGEASFSVMHAEPLWTSPDPTGQSVNGDVRKLAIRLEGATDLRLSVLFTPLRDGVPAGEAPAVTPLADWSVELAEVPTLAGISLDGTALETFAPNAFTYDVALDPGSTTAPIVTAIAAVPGDTVEIRQASAPNGTAVIEVTHPGSAATRYEVHFRDTEPSGAEPIVTASVQGTYPPEHTIDGKLDTFFSAEGLGQWVEYDLGESKPVRGVSLAWYQGNVRSFDFKVQVSGDGVNWSEAYEGSSSGVSLELEAHPFPEVDARYVRIVGYGNSVNRWMSITEARIHLEDGVWPALEAREPVLERVALSAEYDRLAAGGSGRLRLAGTQSDGSDADLAGAAVRYASSDESVAVVSDDGALSFVGEGEATLYGIVETESRLLRYDRLTIRIEDPNKLPAAGDAFVRGGSYANANYGSTPGLTLKKDVTPDFHREGYLTFEVGPIAGKVEAAILYFFASVQDQGTGAGASGHAIDVHDLDGGWEESSVTWNSRPEVGEKFASVEIDNVGQWRAVELPVEALESAAVEGRIDLALLHSPPAGNRYAVQVRSREDAGFAPYIRLTVTDRIEAAWSPEEPDGLDGWYTSSVAMTLNPPGAAEYRITATQATHGSTAPTDGFVPYAGPVTFAEGVYEVQFRPFGTAGATETSRVKVDTEAPSVTVTTYGAEIVDGVPTYAIDRLVRIFCDAEDGMSGLAASSCLEPLLEAQAHELEPGEHTVTAEAVDAAGHRRTVETTFVVKVTFEGLSAVTARFVAETDAAGAEGIANALTRKLANAEAALARGEAPEAALQLQAYLDQLTALSGKQLKAEHAETLAFWASRLKDEAVVH